MSRRRAREEGNGGSDRWLVSYADFITVLMALFLVMFAISEENAAKFAKYAEGFRQGFYGPEAGAAAEATGMTAGAMGFASPAPGEEGKPAAERLAGVIERVLPIRTDPAFADPPPEDVPLPQPEPPEPEPSHEEPPAPPVVSEPAPPPDPMAELKGRLGGMPFGDNLLEPYLTERGLVISLMGRYLFEEGTATIRSDAEPTLAAVADRLRDFGHPILIEGYTSRAETPAGTLPHTLSSERANAVLATLNRNGLLAEQMVAVGISTGEIPSGRVDVIILRKGQ